jgi:hypothetical protein
MADPVSLSLISLGATAAGGAVSAGGSIFGGQAQKKMETYQAGVAQANAVLAQQDANYALVSGNIESQQAGMRGRVQSAGIKTGIASGNIDTGSGSAARVASSQTAITQENEGIIEANAAKRAYGFQVKGAEDVAQAGADISAGKYDQQSGYLKAGGDILSTVGSVSSKWLQGGPAFTTDDSNVNPDSSLGQAKYGSSIY